MSGIVGSKLNHRGSGLIGSLGTDGQHLLSAGAGKTNVFETIATVTAYDDEPIKSDLTALAIREATNESSAAFNLPNSFIETFTDDTNLGTQTNGDRTSGYWSTVSPLSTGSLTNFVAGNWDVGALGSASFGTGTADHAASPDEDGMASTNASASSKIVFAANSAFEVTATHNPAGVHGMFMVLYKTSVEPSGSPANTTIWKFGWSALTTGVASLADSFSWIGGTAWGNSYYGVGGGSAAISFVTSDSDFDFVDSQFTVARDTSGVFRMYQGTSSGTLILTSTSTGGRDFSNTSEYALAWGGTGGQQTDLTNFQYTPVTAASASATGTVIQSANTVASAKTEVGGTMIYKDEDGTATIGTDLKIYFSCNNGGAWTEAASYNAITPVYASGVKHIRLGKTTCTSGTGIIYKAVYANQSLGSKETQLHAIGINY